MNKRVKIAILIALIGMFAILSLQALWMSTSYKLEQKKLSQKATHLTNEAISAHLIENSSIWYDSIKERYGVTPYIGGVSYDDSVVIIKVYNLKTGLYDRFERKCMTRTDLVLNATGISMLYHTCGLDIEQFDRQLDSLFCVNGIHIPHVIEKVNTQTGHVEKTTDCELSGDRFTTVCDTLHLGITGSDGIVVKFDSSFSGMFVQIRFIILSSFIITLFVAIILFGIIRIIVYQQKLSDFRENFVRHMIHEIKNPIVYLKRALEFSEQTSVDKNMQTAVKKIDHINLLIEKLLSTTTTELKIQKRPIDVKVVLENIRASYPDADLKIEIEDGISEFSADPIHYANALLNLVDNAVKYSPGEKRIAIRCYKRGKYLCVAVKDWGVGIPLEFQFLIFDRYFRVPQKKSTNVSGFGLGLTYVKMVAETHGGTVSLSSIYKQGSEFTIEIPYGDK